ncbi:MAG TPA: hypothetical protein DCY35_11610, partial [Prolixibacteraceae bacterium]|nr:hypothetical protein [Prolixibacteraceae bacterium]
MYLMDSTNGKADDLRQETESMRKELEETRMLLEKSRQENLSLERQLNERKMELWGQNAISALQINNILTSIQEIIFIANTNREIEFISPAVYKIAGYQPEEILGQPIRNFVHPDDWHVLQSIKDQLESAGNARVELRAAKKQGGYVWLSVSVSTRFVENQVMEFTGIITDISKVKIIESRLQERDLLNQTLMEASPDVIIFTDWNGNIETVSMNTRAMFGIGHCDEVRGLPLLNFIHADYHSLVVDRISFIKKNKRRGELELVLVKSDGTTFDAGVTGEVIHSTESSPARMVFMVRDISEWRKTERRLVESEARFRLLFETAPVGISIVNSEGKLLMVNRKYTEMTGYTIKEVPDLDTWWSLAYPEESARNAVIEEFSLKMAEFFRTGVPLEPYEGLIHCNDGTQKFLEVSLTTTESIQLVTFVDVTDRKLHSEQILEQKRYIETILSAIRDSKFILDRQGNVIEYIPSNQSIQIITPGQLLGKNIFKALPWLPVDTVKEFMSQTFEGLPTIPFQVEVPGHETIQFVEARMSKIDEERIIVLASDITWRVTAEQDLKETHRRLSVTMNNLRGVVYRCKNETHWPMEFVSQGVADLTGYLPEEFVGTSLVSFGKLIHEDDRSR